MWMKRVAIAVLLCPFAVAGCTEQYPAYPQAPPPPLNEDVPAPPASRVTQSWRPGYYDWNGSGYDWHPGEWIPLAGHSTEWQDGYWRRTGPAAYVWMPPGWR